MNIFIDCEYNGPGGQLVSMALVDSEMDGFYVELEIHEPIVGWVKDNVVPLLNKKYQVSRKQFQEMLERYLSKYERVHLIADWPDDIKYFCESLITLPGERIDTPPLTMEIRRDLDAVSKVPHHARWDAIAIKEQYDYVTNQTSQKETS